MQYKILNGFKLNHNQIVTSPHSKIGLPASSLILLIGISLIEMIMCLQDDFFFFQFLNGKLFLRRIVTLFIIVTLKIGYYTYGGYKYEKNTGSNLNFNATHDLSYRSPD
ncbi:hypothetical protein J23TS9_18820 [Paenibacillus sp. J23TS9]|nr:hypothetical protein J23TS9_18820 [Paenibacillus sp. J23TS9]